MSYQKQHELGLAGLALLRTWLVGNTKVTKKVLQETIEISKLLEDYSQIRQVNIFDVKKGYKKWALTYDDVPNLLIEIEEPVVKSILQKFSPGLALDAGCGTGRYSRYLNALGYSVTGVDLSRDMLKKAQKNIKQVKFIEGNLESLPIKNNSIDLAISALALTHLPNIETAISELARVVKVGGHLILSDIHPWLVALGGQADFYDNEGKYGYVRNYEHWHSSYVEAFIKNNLKINRCVEPILEPKHLNLAKEGFDLSSITIATALQGLPIALIWELEKL